MILAVIGASSYQRLTELRGVSLGRFRRLTADNAQQQVDLDGLEQLIYRKANERTATIGREQIDPRDSGDVGA